MNEPIRIRVEAPPIPYTEKKFPRTCAEAFPKHPDFAYPISASAPEPLIHSSVAAAIACAFLVGLAVGLIL
jgi:hypothetical protein